MTTKHDWNAYAITQANRASKLCRHVERSVTLGEVRNLAGPFVLRENDQGQFVLAHNFENLGIGVLFGNDGFLQNANSGLNEQNRQVIERGDAGVIWL